MDKRDEQAIEAVKAYYQQDLSQAEVAARMGISRPTVAKLLAHGRAMTPPSWLRASRSASAWSARASPTGTPRMRRRPSTRWGASAPPWWFSWCATT